METDATRPHIREQEFDDWFYSREGFGAPRRVIVDPEAHWARLAADIRVHFRYIAQLAWDAAQK